MSLVEIDDVHKVFAPRQRGGRSVHALKGVSVRVDEGETLAVIGESGSGKSTLGRAALRLLDVDSGAVRFDGEDLGELSPEALRRRRSQMQVVFQEPYESLNPRLAIGQAIAEPLQVHRPELDTTAVRDEVVKTLDRVGLPASMATRLPGELSGGQQQRVGVARAIISRPRFLVLDEPTSSLDLSIRAQVLELLAELQRDLSMAYLFVSHDMQTVEWVSDRIAVMYLGEVVETNTTRQVCDAPQHPYTQTLLSARLSPDPRDRHAYQAFAGDTSIRNPTAEEHG